MRLSISWLRFGLAVAAAMPMAARAQTPPAGQPANGLGIAPAGAGTQPSAATAAPANADPVVGSVEGHLIYLSELGDASKTLPENLRGMPFDTL